MKSVSRNKLLLCFRPVVDMETAVLGDCSTAVGASSISQKSAISRPPRQMFSRTARTVVSDLTKRVREKQGYERNQSFRSRLCFLSNEEEEEEEESKAKRKSFDDLSHSSTGSSPSSSSSSSCSSSSSTYREESMNSSESTANMSEKVHKTHHQKLAVKGEGNVILDCSVFSYGMFLVVMSLVMVIFWGKFCAILFTSIWMFLLARQSVITTLGETEVKETYRRRN